MIVFRCYPAYLTLIIQPYRFIDVYLNVYEYMYMCVGVGVGVNMYITISSRAWAFTGCLSACACVSWWLKANFQFWWRDSRNFFYIYTNIGIFNVLRNSLTPGGTELQSILIYITFVFMYMFLDHNISLCLLFELFIAHISVHGLGLISYSERSL